MALLSETSAASGLGSMAKNNNHRISFREDLNDTRHCDDGFSSDDFSDSDDDEEDETSPRRDPDTAEMASMERRALKYRKSLTMLNQISNLQLTTADGITATTAAEVAAANGAKQPTKEHLLAAKKSIDDLTAWVNAAALEGDDDPFGGDDD